MGREDWKGKGRAICEGTSPSNPSFFRGLVGLLQDGDRGVLMRLGIEDRIERLEGHQKNLKI